MARYAIALSLLLASTALAQTHTPSFTVDGNGVIHADAQIGQITPVTDTDGNTAPNPRRVLVGFPVGGDFTTAFGLPGQGIAWEVYPGTYKLELLGYPESDVDPTRNKLVEPAVVVVIERKNQIRAAVTKLLDGLARYVALSPSIDEIATSFID